jgi:CRISPR type III-A-associated protein Csm2
MNDNNFQKELDKKLSGFMDKDKKQVNVAFLKLHQLTQKNEIDVIKKFMADNYKDITSTQLRNIFNEIKRGEKGTLMLKKAKLAYIAGRTKSTEKGMHAFIKLIDLLIDKVCENKDVEYEGFLTFFEASLAYHKYYEKLRNKATI